MPAFEMSEIRGVIPAMITPFDRDERLDEARLRACTRFLIGRGVGGLYLTGSTGEGFLMSQDERKRGVEVVIEEAGKRLPVIVHVGAIGTKLSVELAEHAQSAGADAVSSVPPFYWAFSQDQIYNLMPELFLQIERAVAAGDVEEARNIQAKANTIIFFSLARNMTAIIKRGMAWQGVDAGYCRRPFGNYFDAEDATALKAEFRDLRKAHDLSGVAFLEAL